VARRPRLADRPPPAWTLQWSDEFDGTEGSSPDSTKWAFDTGGNGWGNRNSNTTPLDHKTRKLQNGNLVITAIREAYTGPDGSLATTAAARLKTAGLFSQAYGRFEARIKIPWGQGRLACVLDLGNNIPTSDGPPAAKSTIMENLGSERSTVNGSMHGPGYLVAVPSPRATSLRAGIQ